MASCTKEYIETPSCYRYLELSDKYDGEMVYVHTDTLWPNGRYNNVVCGADVDRLQSFVGKPEGCTGGWQMVRYEILGS